MHPAQLEAGHVAKLDITRTNLAIEHLLDVTENRRHRYLLMGCHRYRYLAMSGRYDELFAPETYQDSVPG